MHGNARAPKVADLKYNTLANGHGPILRYNVEQLVDNYKTWSLSVEKGTVQVRRRRCSAARGALRGCMRVRCACASSASLVSCMAVPARVWLLRGGMQHAMQMAPVRCDVRLVEQSLRRSPQRAAAICAHGSSNVRGVLLCARVAVVARCAHGAACACVQMAPVRCVHRHVLQCSALGG